MKTIAAILVLGAIPLQAFPAVYPPGVASLPNETLRAVAAPLFAPEAHHDKIRQDKLAFGFPWGSMLETQGASGYPTARADSRPAKEPAGTTASAIPSETSEVPSMADEGLVSGITASTPKSDSRTETR